MNTREALVLAADLSVHEAMRLLESATGLRRAALLAAGDLAPADIERFRTLVERRRSGEPLQYVEGSVDFGPITVTVDRRALIPRPETEQLWELATALVPSPEVVVDLCTGSGNLALACKHRWPRARVLATDLSPEAAELAMENAAALRLDVEVLHGDLFDPLPEELRGNVDLVVANPPYLAASELDVLDPQVRDHEPHHALVAGPIGTEVLRRIASEVAEWLAPGGIVVCEISELHPEAALSLFGRLDGEIRHDLTGRPRFVLASRPSLVEH